MVAKSLAISHETVTVQDATRSAEKVRKDRNLVILGDIDHALRALMFKIRRQDTDRGGTDLARHVLKARAVVKDIGHEMIPSPAKTGREDVRKTGLRREETISTATEHLEENMGGDDFTSNQRLSLRRRVLQY